MLDSRRLYFSTGVEPKKSKPRKGIHPMFPRQMMRRRQLVAAWSQLIHVWPGSGEINSLIFTIHLWLNCSWWWPRERLRNCYARAGYYRREFIRALHYWNTWFYWQKKQIFCVLPERFCRYINCADKKHSDTYRLKHCTREEAKNLICGLTQFKISRP